MNKKLYVFSQNLRTSPSYIHSSFPKQRKKMPHRCPEANPRKPGASKQARFNVIFSMAQSIYLLNSDETSGSGYLEGEYIFFLNEVFFPNNFGEDFFCVVVI